MTNSIQLQARIESWPLASEFRIARGTKTQARVVVVELRDGQHRGLGECLPYGRYGETPEKTLSVLNALSAAELNELLTTSRSTGCTAADNALDCAQLDLRAQQLQRPVWSLLDIPPPSAVVTAYTLPIAEPDEMAVLAAAHAYRPLLKIKLGGEDAQRDGERLTKVRQSAPESRLIVDANEGWTPQLLAAFLPLAAELDVAMIEQPLPANADEALVGLNAPVPIGADESVHGEQDLATLRRKYQVVNVKLDKAGGLSAAQRLVAAAKLLEFEIMIGCMVATSLSMAPALLLAATADYVDLDGPLLLSADRPGGLDYHGSLVSWPAAACWGEPRSHSGLQSGPKKLTTLSRTPTND
jgi:L-alanine-DL-glutamate epimerase-like enolase superfamily enzyme